ncbi:TlpA disulfide reductase family protein [Parafrankia discariae]|uniref:TlpA disulfide reductase family protein n=1 Tax=Parafrankia discariae TaxID=365528 RepID=UPI0003A26099|nr:TlpA disulfide reductase family protein [Parafrankia discariae]
MDEIETVDVTVLEAGRTSLLPARIEPGGPERTGFTGSAGRSGPPGRVLVRSAEGGELLGWHLRPQGWCRGDVCIPASVTARRLGVGERGPGSEDWIDVAEFAELTGRLAMVDAARRVVALGPAAASHELRGLLDGGAPDDGVAPDVALPDLEGRLTALSDLRGRKVAVVAWASWCGCRYDLPAWAAQHDELADQGFTLVTVALDADPAAAREWIEAAGGTHPALIDTDGVLAERYSLTNVPTVFWIDEAGHLVRPPDTQTATDTFRSMNGIDSARALAALRRWVTTGRPGLGTEDVRRHLRPPSDDDQRARLAAAIGIHLYRAGWVEAAAGHLEEAGRLSPHQVAIRRGTMRLRGADPFGQEYFDLRAELEANGVPIYRPLPDWQAEETGTEPPPPVAAAGSTPPVDAAERPTPVDATERPAPVDAGGSGYGVGGRSSVDR